MLPVEPDSLPIAILSMAVEPCTTRTSPLAGSTVKSGGGGVEGVSKLRSSIATSLWLSVGSRVENSKPAIDSVGVETEISVPTPSPCVTVTGVEVAIWFPAASYAINVTTAHVSAVLLKGQARAAVPSNPTYAYTCERGTANVPVVSGM